MALRIDLTPEKETLLREEATHRGLPAEDYARELIEERLSSTPHVNGNGAVTYDANGWPEGFFEETLGSLANDPIERLPQGSYERREPLA
jgi:hypothetical protein